MNLYRVSFLIGTLTCVTHVSADSAPHALRVVTRTLAAHCARDVVVVSVLDTEQKPAP